MKDIRKATTRLISLVIIISVLILSGCEGPVGPEGPKGEHGQLGEQGPEGAQGPAGEDANVTLYIFDAPAFTSADPEHTFFIENLTREQAQTSTWEFTFIRGAFTQFIPGTIDFGNEGNRSEFTVEQFYESSTGHVETTVELIGGTGYFPDQLHIFRVEPANTVNAKVNFENYNLLIEYYGEDNITVIDKTGN